MNDHHRFNGRQGNMSGTRLRSYATYPRVPSQLLPYQIVLHHSPNSPPLVPNNVISLPPVMDDTPFTLHPYLRFNHFPSKLQYDIVKPPHTAYLQNQRSDDEWRHLPAVEPPSSNVVSLTIRASGVPRPIVIFPRESNGGIITIWGVFNGVHQAIRRAVEEIFGENVDTVFRHPDLQRKYGMRPKESQFPMDKAGRAQRIYTVMRDFFGGGKQMWTGLYPSRTESDVWVLYMRKEDR